MNATLKKVEEVGPEDLSGYDPIGFGSGIYGGKHHKALLTLVEKIPLDRKRYILLLDLREASEKCDWYLEELLIKKGCRIISAA